MNALTLRMAWRNLWRRGRRTWLTIGAMVFSNGLLVFSVSLQFGGYEMMIDNTLQAWSGHFQLQHRDYLEQSKLRQAFAGADATAARLRDGLGIDSVSVRAAGFALASSADRSHGIQIVGVDAAHEPLVSTLPGLVRDGRYLEPGGGGEIFIGAVLARNLKIALGDELTFIGSGYDGSFAAGVVRVVGIFESGNSDVDRAFAQVNLGYFREVFAMPGLAHAVVARAPNIEAVDALLQRAETLAPATGDLAWRHWEALQPGLRQAIQADMASAWFMYAVLVVLVAFSVLNTQLMSVLERTREFGVVLALGMRPAGLAGQVMLETALMTAIGLALGIAAGAAVSAYYGAVGFSYPGMEDMAAKFNLPDAMYPALSLLSAILGPGVVAIGSLLAAIYPATRLFRLTPIAAMRAL